EEKTLNKPEPRGAEKEPAPRAEGEKRAGNKNKHQARGPQEGTGGPRRATGKTSQHGRHERDRPDANGATAGERTPSPDREHGDQVVRSVKRMDKSRQE